MSGEERKRNTYNGSHNISQLISKKLIQCSFCSETFSYETQLLFHHEHTHADKLHFACSMCKQKFATISLLSEHVLKHNIQSIFKCSKCSKSFTTPIILVKHKCNTAVIYNDRIVGTDTSQSLSMCSKLANEHVQSSGSVLLAQCKPGFLINKDKTLEVKLQSRYLDHEPKLQSRQSDHEPMFQSRQSDYEPKLQSRQSDHEPKLQSRQSDHEAKLHSRQYDHEPKLQFRHPDHESELQSRLSDNELKLTSSRHADHEPKLQSMQSEHNIVVTWMPSKELADFTDDDVLPRLSYSSVVDMIAGEENNNFKYELLTEAKLREHDQSYDNNQQLDPSYLLKKDLNNGCTSVSSDDSDKTLPWCPDAQSHSEILDCSKKNLHVVNEKRSYCCSRCDRMFTMKSSLNRHSRTHTDNERTFKCAHCVKTFLYKHHLKQHEGTHSGARQRTFKCAQCRKGFFHKQNLDRHESTHLSERYPCSICGRMFIGMRGLTLHQLIHSTELNYVCTVCDRKFPRLSDLTAHSRRQHRNKQLIICNKCDISFSNTSTLRVHMKNVHGDERSWLCVHCGESYTKKERYKHRHFEVLSTDRHACSQCDKSFSLPLSLKTHMKMVHGDNKEIYICTSCGKIFTTKSSLNAHKVIHSGDKQFTCDQCDKTCYRRYDLTMHVRRKHSNKDSSNPLLPCMQCEKIFKFSTNLQAHVRRMHAQHRPFLCSKCGNSYTTKASLLNHIVVHDELRHECTQCNKKFKHLLSLKYHMNRVHSKTKPSFVCFICYKVFTSKGSLKCHTLIHTGERRHVCEQCDKRFTKSYDLKIHIRRVHSNIRPFQCTQCEKKFATKGQLVVHRVLHCTAIQTFEETNPM